MENLTSNNNHNTLEKFNLIAKTYFGLEEVLANELNDLGAEEIEIRSRAVSYKGDMKLLYKSNLHLRTAIKILKPIATFTANNEHQLYERVQRIPWHKYFSLHQTFAIDGTTSGDLFTHSKYVALKTKDAIVDQFRDKFGRRPDVDPRDPDLRINVHIAQNKCSIALDSSGLTLAKRGYRMEQVQAPMSEALAAGIILLSGWDKKSDFIDPMCGSGTFSIEAALLATNTPPGIQRSFAFEKWNEFDENIWKKIRSEAREQMVPLKAKIMGYDLESDAVNISRDNARRARVGQKITFEKTNFLESEANGVGGLVFINPPYDERLEIDSIIELYKEMGTCLKHKYEGYDAWIISGNLEALKFVGLRPSKKIKLYNGQLECRLQKYELYRGSKKAKKATSEKM